MAVTEESKVRARHHLGYLGVNEASTFVLGVPAAVQTQFVIEGALNRLLPQSEPLFYKLLDRLDAVELLIEENTDVLIAEKVDEIGIDPEEMKKMVKRYLYWRAGLGNLLGAPPNPFDMRFDGMTSGGGSGPMPLNISVNHG